MNSGLAQAVAIFKELGWADATPEQALSLALGTPEQRRVALAGLKSGEWGEYAQLEPNTYGWRSFIDVDRVMLSIFAVRLGIDARRTVQVLPRPGRWGTDSLLTAILAERSPAFAESFIAAACKSGRDFGPVYGSVPLRLLALHQLPIPDNLGYLEDWAHYANITLNEQAHWDPNLEQDLEPVIFDRFAEHVRTGVALGLAGMGPFNTVVTEGVRRGILDRYEAVELVFAALDAAGRPGDRKVWLQVLDKLGIADDELVARTDALIPLLAGGDSFLIERVAPVLIARVDDLALLEVLVASLSIKVKKTLKIVLQAVANRQRPEQAEELAPQLVELAADRDRAIARLASSIIQSWDLESAVNETSEAPLLQGLWQSTPPVWQVPKFDKGEATSETLTVLAAELFRRPEGVDDVTVERFLAVANAVAYSDLESAKAALRGVRGFPGVIGLRPVPAWLAGVWPKWGLDRGEHVSDILRAREFAVFQRLGQVPCLLSEPSTIDFTIWADDLVARLENYQAAGVSATEADLFLAITRVAPSSVTPELMNQLEQQRVPVVLQSGDLLKDTAGLIAVRYLANPISEPEMVVGSRGNNWVSAPISPSSGINRSTAVTTLIEAGFPDRMSQYLSLPNNAIFPHWGDAALRHVSWGWGDAQHEIGLLLRQAARRATPLPAGAAINFLAAQRSMSATAAPDGVLAVTEAWERGLLRPGVADVTYLDWRLNPGNFAALAKALVEVALTGLLSVVWPILDDVIAISLKAPRLLAGTAELAEAVQTLLPEAVAAVTSGLAEPSALDLPAIRALAARSGTAKAVAVAREITAQLPPPTVVAPVELASVAPLDLSFDEVWPAAAGTLPAIPDGVAITADWHNPDAPTRVLAFSLVLPDLPDRFVVLSSGWIYGLEVEGQCRASQIQPGTPKSGVRTEYVDDEGFVPRGQSDVWLHWDAKLSHLVVTQHRNWRQNKNGPLSGNVIATLPGASVPPLSNALVTVAIGMLGHDGEHSNAGARLLRKLSGLDHNHHQERIGSAALTAAVRALLNSPAVSMAKLVKPLEGDVKLLPTCWPLLTEPIRAAGATQGPLPTWLNRVLDVALRYAPYLAEAAHRGLIPSEAAAWPGLSEIAARPGKSTAVNKAKKLLNALGITQT